MRKLGSIGMLQFPRNTHEISSESHAKHKYMNVIDLVWWATVWGTTAWDDTIGSSDLEGLQVLTCPEEALSCIYVYRTFIHTSILYIQIYVYI